MILKKGENTLPLRGSMVASVQIVDDPVGQIQCSIVLNKCTEPEIADLAAHDPRPGMPVKWAPSEEAILLWPTPSKDFQAVIRDRAGRDIEGKLQQAHVPPVEALVDAMLRGVEAHTQRVERFTRD
jgi:hypothetical protein